MSPGDSAELHTLALMSRKRTRPVRRKCRMPMKQQTHDANEQPDGNTPVSPLRINIW
jgi:hypothetical protein